MRTGVCRFLLQALHALRRDLQSLGSDLVVRVGRPEDVLPQMVQSMVGRHSYAPLLSHTAQHAYTNDSPRTQATRRQEQVAGMGKQTHLCMCLRHIPRAQAPAVSPQGSLSLNHTCTLCLCLVRRPLLCPPRAQCPFTSQGVYYLTQRL